MALEFLLEEFHGAAERPAQAADTDGATPEAQTQSYEQGYAAGWEDAIQAEEEAQRRVQTEFARNLQDLNFTFHEARAHVMRAFEPLLDELVATFMPKLAHAALGPKILEELMPFVELAADTQVELLVPPGAASIVGPLIEEHATMPLKLTEEPTLCEGQALIRSQKLQRKIDLAGASQHIADALQKFYENKEQRDAG